MREGMTKPWHLEAAELLAKMDDGNAEPWSSEAREAWSSLTDNAPTLLRAALEERERLVTTLGVLSETLNDTVAALKGERTDAEVQQLLDEHFKAKLLKTS